MEIIDKIKVALICDRKRAEQFIKKCINFNDIVEMQSTPNEFIVKTSFIKFVWVDPTVIKDGCKGQRFNYIYTTHEYWQDKRFKEFFSNGLMNWVGLLDVID